jgi:sulfate transport system ATP-binding protein
MPIEIRGLSKSFGAFVALRDVDLSIRDGELIALLGPSGSGKTTLLRAIAGLEMPESGQIVLRRDGVEEDWTRQHTRQRNIGFVFQQYALFPHMSVFENIAFGLRVRREKRDVVRTRVAELLKLVQLDGLEKRLPSQLSGGQRQRVALARALASRPQVLLLDEPFGALDARVRRDLRRWLRALHHEIRTTSVFVTHDQDEAFELADRVAIVHEGRIQQVGTPAEVLASPANAFVAEFLDIANRPSLNGLRGSAGSDNKSGGEVGKEVREAVLI